MIDDLKPLIGKLTVFAKDRMGFSRPPKLFLKQDLINSQKMLGRTAHYDPQNQAVTLYVSGRHPKDILRSYAHELVHHLQNLRGDLDPKKMGSMGDGYAQENDHMRNMEKEAYLQGNMCFRDFEDGLEDEDKKRYKLAESKFLKENKIMTKNKIKEITGLGDMARETADKPELSTLEAEAMVRTMIDMFTDDNDGFGVMQTLDNMGSEFGRGKGSLGGEAFNALNQVYDALLKANNRHHSQQNTEDESSPDEVEDIAESKLKKENKTMTTKITKEFLKEMIEKILETELAKPSKLPPKKRTGVSSGEKEEIEVKPVKKENEETEGDVVEEENEELEEAGKKMVKHPKTGKMVPDYAVDGKGSKDEANESKIQTPEEENTLYEQRFTPKNNRLYEKLVKQWTK